MTWGCNYITLSSYKNYDEPLVDNRSKVSYAVSDLLSMPMPLDIALQNASFIRELAQGQQFLKKTQVRVLVFRNDLKHFRSDVYVIGPGQNYSTSPSSYWSTKLAVEYEHRSTVGPCHSLLLFARSGCWQFSYLSVPALVCLRDSMRE